MTQIEGVEKLAGAVGGIEIDGPGTDDDRVVDIDEDEVAPGEEREPDDFERELESKLPGIDSVRIEGPGGTTGREAIETVVRSTGAEALFDAGEFTVVPTLDGQATDTLKFMFGGGVAFEAADADGQRLFDALTLGKEVELRIAADVVAKAGNWKRKADDTEVVTGKIGLKVHTLRIVPPEEL